MLLDVCTKWIFSNLVCVNQLITEIVNVCCNSVSYGWHMLQNFKTFLNKLLSWKQFPVKYILFPHYHPPFGLPQLFIIIMKFPNFPRPKHLRSREEKRKNCFPKFRDYKNLALPSSDCGLQTLFAVSAQVTL